MSKKKQLPNTWIQKITPIVGVVIFAAIGTLLLQQLFAATPKKNPPANSTSSQSIVLRPEHTIPATLQLDGSVKEIIITGTGLATARAKVGGLEMTTVSSSNTQLTIAIDTSTLLNKTSIERGESRYLSVELTAPGTAAAGAPSLKIIRP